ncbi:MAG: macro domain-containing protein [Nitrospira sp.]
MGDTPYKVVSDRMAAAQILEAHGAYHAFWGAGLSVEAGVPTANQICQQIAKSQLRLHGFGEDAPFDSPDARAWLAENLAWDRSDERYAKCIRTQYANPADRVDFFRRALTRVSPSFAHHGAAILMNEGILGRTCLTTNFDKLLENAFATQGIRECQPLRTGSEVQFWRPDPERCFCMKLHGDYDTHNVLNTDEETVRIDEALRTRSSRLLEHQGLVIVGLAGYEKSVYSFFEDLTMESSLSSGTFDRGLLWGVFVGSKPREPMDSMKLENTVREAIHLGEIGPEIKKMMTRMATSRVQFAFFPVFGSGQFLIDLIELSGDRRVIGRAEPYLDHEMRLRRVFAGANLPPQRVDEHIRKLKRPNPGSTNPDEQGPSVERAFELTRKGRNVWVAYGDIASRSYLGNESFNGHVRAVVSPDDTFLSVGGGVAVALADKAGMRTTLHEVSKFAPVPQGESRVTSGGFLPVHYIIHAATIEVSIDGYRVTGADVRRTFKDVLRRAAALGVGVLSVPLLGTGVAGLLPEDSFRGLLEGYNDLSDESNPTTVVFVVYREAQLARSDARAMVERILGADDSAWSDEPWPSSVVPRVSL